MGTSSKSYTWIFSGVGAGVIFFVLQIGWNIFWQPSGESKNNTIQKDTIKAQVQKKEVPFLNKNPIQIDSEITSAPPYQRQEKAKYYIGNRVCWDVSLASVNNVINKERDVFYVITFFKLNYNFIQVRFDASINDYPVLKVAKEGEKFKVEGIIKEWDYGFNIELEKITPL